jgi:hypothetical protein
MLLPRSSQICLLNTPFYHCVYRCVRCSFLCGIDSYSDQSYEHRRAWFEERLWFCPHYFPLIYVPML